MKLLAKTKSALPKYYPADWKVFKLVSPIGKEIDISNTAIAYFDTPRNDHLFKDYLIARPVGYPATVWLEYQFPKSFKFGANNTGNSSLHQYRVGILAHWHDNNSDDVPQTLFLKIVQEQDTEIGISVPNDLQIPIGRNGFYFGKEIVYSFGQPLLATKDIMVAYLGMIIMPALMHLNLRNT
jgi:hypothetical protein